MRLGNRPARPGLSSSVADRSTDAYEERLDQLCVFGVEHKMPAIARQIAIGSGQSDRVGKAIGPDDRPRSVEWSTAATQSIRAPNHASPRFGVTSDPQIVGRLAALGPTLALALRHALLCADTGRRVKGSVRLTRRTKRLTA